MICVACTELPDPEEGWFLHSDNKEGSRLQRYLSSPWDTYLVRRKEAVEMLWAKRWLVVACWKLWGYGLPGVRLKLCNYCHSVCILCVYVLKTWTSNCHFDDLHVNFILFPPQMDSLSRKCISHEAALARA